jgi:hypothetical protein
VRAEDTLEPYTRENLDSKTKFGDRSLTYCKRELKKYAEWYTKFIIYGILEISQRMRSTNFEKSIELQEKMINIL